MLFTDAGPIQRRVVKTKEGGKRTLIVVKKENLDTLQAKGLIKPITKCRYFNLDNFLSQQIVISF